MCSQFLNEELLRKNGREGDAQREKDEGRARARTDNPFPAIPNG
jgi:hypothetical protein